MLQRHHAFQRIFEGGALHRTPALIVAHLVSIAANLPVLYRRFEALEIGVHLYLEGWFTCMFAKVLCFVLLCPCVWCDARPVLGASACVSCLGPVLMRWRCRSVSCADIYLLWLLESLLPSSFETCLKVQDRHSSAPSARSWCVQMSH